MKKLCRKSKKKKKITLTAEERKLQHELNGTQPSNEQDDWEDESSSSEESEGFFSRNQGPTKIPDDELFQNYPIREVKMVLCVRDDLKMGKGKIGAQCGHATLGTFKSAQKLCGGSKYWTKVMEKWTWEGQKKICVKVKDESDLLEVQKLANKLGIPSYMVADAGRTQIQAGSLTVCGLGPVESQHVN